MKVLFAILTLRATLLVLNGLVLALGILSLVATGTSRGLASSSILVAAAYISAFLAFALRSRKSPVMYAVIVLNALMVLLSGPFVFFASRTEVGFGTFALLVLALIAIPVINVANAWLRLSAAAASSN